ncbi:hypothetical protein ACT3SQ_02815 [Brachybacterium sp. AOP42-C2-15]|uniref:hypothetical protein n=1 Tax=Brachybacterium sp. AOP42-C2-15 TaxID=3457670 RepID=UPI0040348A1E
MDWSTVTVSALISTGISASIGLGIASQTKVIQMRAEERELARREIVEKARELQLQLLNHQDARNHVGPRSLDVFDADDLSTAWRFVRAAQQLGWVRKRVTLRVLRRIFGQWVVDRVRLMKDDSGNSAFVAHVGAAFRSGPQNIDTGSLHVALSAPSASDDVDRALRDLRLLERL